MDRGANSYRKNNDEKNAAHRLNLPHQAGMV